MSQVPLQTQALHLENRTSVRPFQNFETDINFLSIKISHSKAIRMKNSAQCVIFGH